MPRALPYRAPSPEAWLAADPCHAVPNPCAEVAPFTYAEVRDARAPPVGRGGRGGGGRLPALSHLAPLTPTAPWSKVSRPSGSGPNPYWVTGQAGTSIPGLAPGFGPPDPAASMVLIVAGESALGKDTGPGAASAASAATSARRSLLAPPPPPPPPPRASWAGTLSRSSPRLPKDGGDARRYSATPLVVDTEGTGYSFQVSSAGDWLPALALHRGEFPATTNSSTSEEKNDLLASSPGPLSESPNSAALSVGAPLERGALYTLVVTTAAGAADAAAAAPADAAAGEKGEKSDGGSSSSPSSSPAAVGDWVALASGPGGVYPGSTSIPPRWMVASSTTAAVEERKSAAGSSSSSPSSSSSAPEAAGTSRGLLRRPAVSGSTGGDNDTSAVVAVATVPFVTAGSAQGFEWRVSAGAASASASASASTGRSSWSPWVAVYDLAPFQAAAGAPSGGGGGSGTAVTAGLVAAAVAPEGSTSVSLRGLSLRGGGRRYALVVGGRTPADAGEFVAEVFGPEAVKGYVSPEAAATAEGVDSPPPPLTTPPAIVPVGAPSALPPALAPAPAPSSDSPPSPASPFVDPPAPPPVPFVQYGIQVRLDQRE